MDLRWRQAAVGGSICGWRVEWGSQWRTVVPGGFAPPGLCAPPSCPGKPLRLAVRFHGHSVLGIGF
eukprot:5862486-Prymnesium_polylepis.1